MNKMLFGTDGVRGVTGVDLTPDFITRLAMAIGYYFTEGSRILVGMDYRAGNDAIKKIVEGVLTLSGHRVYDAGVTPTPALQYVVKTQGFDAGVMITASHNPPEYSGIKVIGPNGIEIDRDEEKVVEELYREMRFRTVNWRVLSHHVVQYPYVNEKYINAVIAQVDKEKISRMNYKVLVDPANNTGALTTPLIIKKLGAKPLVINGTLDIEPARYPEPTPESLSQTSQAVLSFNADLGVAHDGDADRSIFIDEKGKVHWGDRSATLIARHLVIHRKEKGRIYTGVSSSTIIEEVLNPLGIEVVWLKVGSVDIAHAMRRGGDALCGFEENGGFMYPPHQFVRDGGMTLALFLELMAFEGRRASDLFNELPVYYTVKTKYRMNREDALKVIERLKQEFKNERLITIDGVKVISNKYWLLVRPSGTEPLLRVMIEAAVEDIAKDILSRVESIIKEVVKV